ncbi:MAG: hypothetical protein PHH44_04925, partial [bacterium]|nr:hypothetical protein [bacterium]
MRIRRICGLVLPMVVLVYARYVSADVVIDEAWKALVQKDYTTAERLSTNSLQKAKNKALIQQQQLKAGKLDSVAGKEQTIIKENPELHSAGTACYIQAEIYKAKGQKSEAIKKYQEIIADYPNALCWDPRGWYWNVAEVAQDKLDTMDTKYDYGDYRSETLTVKAWN